MKRTAQYVAAALAVFLMWEVVSVSLLAVRGRVILPTPVITIQAGIRHFGELSSAFGASALRFLVALSIAFGLGLPTGLAVGFERGLYQTLSPLIYLAYPIPPVALLVFLYLAFGVGEAVKIVVITAALFFQVVVAAQGAARGIPRTYVTAEPLAALPPRGYPRHATGSPHCGPGVGGTGDHHALHRGDQTGACGGAKIRPGQVHRVLRVPGRAFLGRCGGPLPPGAYVLRVA